MKTVSTNQLSKTVLAKGIFIVVFCFLEFLLLNSHSAYSSIVAVATVLLSAFWDRSLPLALYICLTLLKVSISTTETILIFAIIIIGSINELKYKRSLRKYEILVILFALSSFLSTITGVNTSFTAWLFLLFSWICTLAIGHMFSSERYIYLFVALLVSGLTVLLMQRLHPLSFLEEDAVLNSKDIATAIAALVFLLIWMVVNGKTNLFIKIFLLLVAITGVITIINTYSRGVLIALFSSILYIIFTGIKNKKVLFLAIAFWGVVSYVSISDVVVDYERLSANIEGGNGRTEIWMNFILKMEQSGALRMIFGCGPGGLTKLTIGGTYAHSAIFDYFFSFGILGFIFIVYFLSAIIVKLIKIKSRFFIGIYILNFLMFLTHGNYVEPLFLFLLGLCMGAACNDRTDVVPYKSISFH